MPIKWTGVAFYRVNKYDCTLLDMSIKGTGGAFYRVGVESHTFPKYTHR
jgi:hypothetical protein